MIGLFIRYQNYKRLLYRHRVREDFWYPTDIAVSFLCPCRIQQNILNTNTVLRLFHSYFLEIK